MGFNIIKGRLTLGRTRKNTIELQRSQYPNPKGPNQSDLVKT